MQPVTPVVRVNLKYPEKPVMHPVRRKFILCSGLQKYAVSFTNIFLFFFSQAIYQRSHAQTCPYGSPSASTGYAVTAAGAASGTANATGAILGSGSTLNTGNSATLNATVATIDLDFQKWVAQGSTLTVAWARSGGTPTANVFYSNDSVTFTSLGTLSGSGSTSSVYTNFTVPAGGLRYIRITRTGGTLFIDGTRRTHTCYYPVSAKPDTRVFMNPGTATGNVIKNDSNADMDTRRVYPGYVMVGNGTLTLDTFGNYSYIPDPGFDGIDYFSYTVCDAGPDGNINTTVDNTCDTALVLFRSLFNCDSAYFFMQLPENEAMDFLEDIQTSNGDPIQVYAGLSVSSDAIVIYDHWEDGYETDIRAPQQASTKVWGDGDPVNGTAPGFPNDILNAGEAIILSNSISTGHTGSNTYDPNAPGNDATLQGTIDYDGKDKIFIGGQGALAKFGWGTAGTLSMAGTSVPSVFKWDTSYIVPVGQNTGGGGVSLEIASLSVMAAYDNTIIRIDRNADGTVDITDTLDEGETRYVDSYYGGSPVAVNEGATVRASRPVMVTLMTGNYQTSSPGYEGRSFSLLPLSQYSTCYYMPAVPQENMRVFFYNPNSSAITITRTTAGGATSTINVAANAGNYQDVNTSGLGFQYCASSPFTMLCMVDHGSATSDWGFIPVPTANLTPKVLMSFGAGVDPTNASYGTLNYTQALVTVDDTTYLYVDVDGDGFADNVSFNSDIDATDNTVSIGGISYDETTSSTGILLQSYQTLTIGGTGGTLNGATFWTRTAQNNGGTDGANIILVWGQNGGANAAPNLDAGYTVPNIDPFISNSVVTRSSDSICTGSNIDSITVRYSGTPPYRVFWFNENTNSFSTFNTNRDTFVIKNLEPGTYLIKLKDANCQTFSRRTTIYERTSGCILNVSGTLFNDSNGLTDAQINGRSFGDPSGTPVYSFLLDNLDVVVDSALVGGNGTFSLSGVRYSSYTLRISTTPAGIGDAAPSMLLPATWVPSGEHYGNTNYAGTGIQSGPPDGEVPVTIYISDISGIRLGIERNPVNQSQNHSISVPSFNLNDTLILNHAPGGPGAPSASDGEDGLLSTGDSLWIFAPDSNELYYDINSDFVLDPGEQITDSLYIPSFNPQRLIARFSSTGSTGMNFSFSFTDRAGIRGPSGQYSLTWLVALPLYGSHIKTECTGDVRVLRWWADVSNRAGTCLLYCSQDGQNWTQLEEMPFSYQHNGRIYFEYRHQHAGSGSLIYSYELRDASGQTFSTVKQVSECMQMPGPDFSLFPNPSEGEVLLVSASLTEETVIRIYDASGREVTIPRRMQSGNIMLDFRMQPLGVYMVVCSDDSGTVSRKLIIQR